MFLNIVRWGIPKEKNKEQFEVWREMIDYQKSHPEKEKSGMKSGS